MNTLEINKILSRNSVTTAIYLGCFPSDQLPQGGTQKYPYCMVVNVDPSDLNGSHWVAIYCHSPHNVEYYDSLGDWPPLSDHISRYLSTFSRVRYNSMPLQSSYARSCGRHVIFFLYNRCAGKSFEQIVHFLRYGTKATPDRVVNHFVRERIFDDINNNL